MKVRVPLQGLIQLASAHLLWERWGAMSRAVQSAPASSLSAAVYFPIHPGLPRPIPRKPSAWRQQRTAPATLIIGGREGF